MAKTAEIPFSQKLIVGMLLAFAGGFLDAFTYLTRGGVFAYAQTANMLLCAIRIVEGNFDAILRYLVPILCFTAGLFFSRGLSQWLGRPDRDRERLAVLILEIGLLVFVGLADDSIPNLAVTGTVSFISAMQFSVFRLLDGNPYATTMCTGNLRVTVEALYDFTVKRDRAQGLRSLKYFCVLLAFGCGAALCAYLTTVIGTYAAFVAAAPLLGVIGLLIADDVLRSRRERKAATACEGETK